MEVPALSIVSGLLWFSDRLKSANADHVFTMRY